MKSHTDLQYEAELRALRERLILMATKVEEMLISSMKALLDRDTDLAEQTMERDREINRLEVEIDERCLRVLARRQPVASDLRFITTALKLVTDIERIGDATVNICERVKELNDEPPLFSVQNLSDMGDATHAMLREALDAFIEGDADRAQAVIERDSTVDAYYAEIFRQLLTYMMENPRNIYRCTRAQSIAKYLERIADHATNLAEQIVFMTRGKDIRHPRSRADRRQTSNKPPPVAPR